MDVPGAHQWQKNSSHPGIGNNLAAHIQVSWLVKTSNGSGTLILSELDLTFIKNHNISVLPLLVMERVIFD